MGVLVPPTLTADPRPVHPPVHAAPAPANKPSRVGIAHIPQGSRVRSFRVVPGHSVPDRSGISHIRPIPALPGAVKNPDPDHSRPSPPAEPVIHRSGDVGVRVLVNGYASD